jgi:hypothetical protein
MPVMPIWSIAFGTLLIAVGLEGYTNALGIFNVKELHSWTALIPAGFGAFLVFCGLLAIQPSMRKHMMHLAAGVGLIGALAGLFMAVPKLGELWRDEAKRPSAIKLQLTMGIICLVFLGLCVRSFIQASRARKQAIQR